MSYGDYKDAIRLSIAPHSFASLIMAAYRKADIVNQNLLELAFPELIKELKMRNSYPGGKTIRERQNGYWQQGSAGDPSQSSTIHIECPGSDSPAPECGNNTARSKGKHRARDLCES